MTADVHDLTGGLATQHPAPSRSHETKPGARTTASEKETQVTTTLLPDIETLRIGVLCGGNSPERRGSLASGEHASKALASAGLKAELIDTADTSLAEIKERVDVALLGLHGLGGEDGKIQGALETAGIPYTGSGVLASAIGMHKPTFKQLLTRAVIDTPRWAVVNPKVSVESTLSMVQYTLGFPVFVKPSSGGGSLAAGIAKDEHELRKMIEEAKAEQYTEFMVEEYVQGIPCTVGLLEVEGRLQTLPVHDVQPLTEFYDYASKHDESLRIEHCPSILPPPTTESMGYLARRVAELIGAHGVLRVDFMASSSGRVTVLEANTLPGLSEKGNLATMARAASIPFLDLVKHVVRTAYTKPEYLP
ncbi:D-alanine--D-alanine ligase [Streptomyces albidoflavus]|uniref:D-alanine--D-alanine ligase n=1 Tax=Streptomyces wadayamensis TaxID=141454 RepID=A0ABR4S5K3_9ACTN|nr:D-alanine--D-alanine ligase [Streptomyces albidoflavus]KDR60926.1 D-alanine--D-alanine ligase [Streptomyces wadayamensis]QXQ25879.1 D-alanine--D-alanine ligase [Streptomyces albidoflavus]QXQ31808.1 D-alanine--D-alanine ligase [Streptomyces albidoflavus]